jgi:hypothetical protein
MSGLWAGLGETDFAGREFLAADDLAGMKFPPVHWFIDEVVPEGLTLLVGPPKAGKSYLALQWAVGIGRKIPVLYVPLEDGPRRLNERLHTTGWQKGSHLEFFLRAQQGDFDFIAPWLERHERALVVIDTVGRMLEERQAGSGRLYQEDVREWAAIQAMASRPGTGILGVHHTRKAAAEDFLATASGTHGISGTVDTVIAVERKRFSGDAKLSVTGRDVAEHTRALEFASGRWEDKGRSSDVESEALLALVQEKPGVSQTEAAEGLGWPRAKVQRVAARAAAQSSGLRVEAAGAGKPTRLWVDGA